MAGAGGEGGGGGGGQGARARGVIYSGTATFNGCLASASRAYRGRQALLIL